MFAGLEHSGVCKHKAAFFLGVDVSANSPQGQTASQTLQASVSMLQFNVYDSTIRKRLN